jgi:general secretion pathway protein C
MMNLAARMSDDRAAVLRRAVEVILGLLILLQVVRLGLILFAPQAPVVTVGQPSQRLIDTGILARFDPFNRQSGATAAPVVQGLKLFGLRSGPGGGAILAGADGVQSSYGIGQEVEPGLVVSSVHMDHVVLSRGGQLSRLYFEGAAPAQSDLPPPPPPPPTESNSPVGSAATIRGIDFSRLGQEAGLTPADGGGFVLAPRGGGMLLAMAGLRAGDIITALDGQPLNADSGGSLAGQLAGRTSAQITFLRDGQQMTVTLQVPRL